MKVWVRFLGQQLSLGEIWVQHQIFSAIFLRHQNLGANRIKIIECNESAHLDLGLILCALFKININLCATLKFLFDFGPKLQFGCNIRKKSYISAIRVRVLLKI